MTYREPKATTTLPGLIILAGDLGGTATSPSVLKINGSSVPAGGSLTTGNVLQVSGSSSLTYGTLAVGNLTAGTANQVLINSATPTPTWTTLSGDVTNVLGVMTVGQIAGSSPINITTAATLQWSSGVSSPTLAQQTIGTGTTAQALTIQAQNNSNTGSTGGILSLTSGTGTTSAGAVILKTGGTTRLTANATGVITIANLGTGVVHADSSGNLTSSTVVDADVSAAAAIAVSKLSHGTTGQVLITNSTTPTWTSLSSDVTVSATGTTTVNSISGSTPIAITPAELQWTSATTSPKLDQVQAASGAGTSLTITAQQGATSGNQTGGNLVISSGAGGGSGTAGSLQLQVGTTSNLTLTSALLAWSSGITLPAITQTSAAGATTNFTISAQSSTSGNNAGGNLVLKSGALNGTGFDGYVLFQTGTSNTTQAFVTAALTGTTAGGLGIGSTPGTSPTVSSGSGVPSTTQPNGSIFLRTDGTSSTGLYTRQSAAWSAVGGGGSGSLTAPVTATPVTTNTSNSTYTIDTTGGGSDYLILHNKSGAVSYVMPTPTNGRFIELQDITGAINTTANNVFLVPHAAEKFNTSSGATLSGTFNVTNGGTSVTASTSQAGILAVGMSLLLGNDTVSRIISAFNGTTGITLAVGYGGTTNGTASGTITSLTWAANFGRLFVRSNGTDWFVKGDGTHTQITYTANGTFIPPAGVTNVSLVGFGGGGGGGGGGATSTNTRSGGGGGGGSIQSAQYISTTPNTLYTIAVGSGGAGGAASATTSGPNGSPGGDTSFGSLATFIGASGGHGGNTSSNQGGGGLSFRQNSSISPTSDTNVYVQTYTSGVPSGAIVVYSPGAGGSSYTGPATPGDPGLYNLINTFSGGSGGSSSGSSAGGGGGGGAGPEGAGGNGGAGTSSGSAGNGGAGSSNTGAGGGGGGSAGAGGSAGSGGNGGSGQLIINYVL